MSKTSSVTPYAKSEEIVQVLKSARRPLSISDIARQAGFNSYTACKNALFELLAEGKIFADRVGYYWLFSPADEEIFIRGVGWVKKSELGKDLGESQK